MRIVVVPTVSVLRWLGMGLLLLAAGCRAATEDAPGPALRSGLADQRQVAVTIYNENLALIKDQREITLPQGAVELEYREVSAQMRPETAMLRAVRYPAAFSVLEQNFNFDLLTPDKLLEKYVGREVRFIRVNPVNGRETDESATILSTNGGVVARFADRIETNPSGRRIFEHVPGDLRDRPTLTLDLNSAARRELLVELSYLSGGLSWQADYVAELSADDTALDLLGWVTLTNRSGTAYNDATLQLVAGDVNRVKEAMQVRRELVTMAAVAEDASAGMAQEALFEYHLYTLGRTTDIADNQTKQVSLLNAADVPVVRNLVLEGARHYYSSQIRGQPSEPKVAVYVSFDNDEASRLGVPLPKGIVRVYKRDTAGNAQFVGEDRVDHTPKQRSVKLRLGTAFDVTTQRRQTDYRRRSAAAPHHYKYETEHEIRLFNAKPDPVTVTVREVLPGEWEITRSTHSHQRSDAHTAEWQVDVPAQGETTLTYRAEVLL